MEDEVRTFLVGAYRSLEMHQKMLNQVMIVSYALRDTVRELGLEAEKTYLKHLQAQIAAPAPIQTEGDTCLKDLAKTLDLLGRVA